MTFKLKPISMGPPAVVTTVGIQGVVLYANRNRTLQSRNRTKS